jgi:hypothetical protein
VPLHIRIFCKSTIDKPRHAAYNIKKSFYPINVEEEIKTNRHLQRAGRREAGRTQFVKWTTEGAVKGFLLVFRDLRHA